MKKVIFTILLMCCCILPVDAQDQQAWEKEFPILHALGIISKEDSVANAAKNDEVQGPRMVPIDSFRVVIAPQDSTAQKPIGIVKIDSITHIIYMAPVDVPGKIEAPQELGFAKKSFVSPAEALKYGQAVGQLLAMQESWKQSVKALVQAYELRVYRATLGQKDTTNQSKQIDRFRYLYKFVHQEEMPANYASFFIQAEGNKKNEPLPELERLIEVLQKGEKASRTLYELELTHWRMKPTPQAKLEKFLVWP